MPDVSAEPYYYQEEFRQIFESGEQYKGRFNWAAFFVGVLWALVRDLPYVGGVWLVTAVLTGFIPVVDGLTLVAFVAYSIYFGFRANYLRYVALYKGQQALVE